MYRADDWSFSRRFIHSLIPSPISAVWSVVIGVNVVALYHLFLSVSFGTSLPNVLDGQWGIAYTNNVVRPLLALFSSAGFNNVGVIILWGLAGLAFYFVLEYVVHLIRSFGSAEHTVQMTPRGIVEHPTLRSFFETAAWRVGVLIVFVPLLIVGAKDPFERLSMNAPHVIMGQIPNARTIRDIVLIILEFIVLSHVIVVFLRLFTMRTRLFGDDPL